MQFEVDVLLLVDHIAQVQAVEQALQQRGSSKPINVYIKIDSGYRRAGLTIDSPALPKLVNKIIGGDLVAIWGVYSHAGHAYGSSDVSQAEAFLSEEVKSVNEAAKIIRNLLSSSQKGERHRKKLMLSVGCTPTAHAAGKTSSNLARQLEGDLELHAGNYSFLDLQQVATGAIADSYNSALHRCALRVLATVISVYPGRGSDGKVKTETNESASEDDEALCNAGGIALSKDTGPLPGYGFVILPEQYQGWKIARVSQEHGIMTLEKKGPLQAQKGTKRVQIGDRIQIIPQHACMVAAAHPHYFIIDSSKKENIPTIQDIWIPWKGW